MTSIPTSLKVTCATLPQDYCVCMWICDYFAKFLTKRSMTQMNPRWPLSQLLLRSHVQLYHRIIVSNSHKNTSKHVDTVTFFSKTLTKGQWPLDDIWLHFYWGHVCDSTQESLEYINVCGYSNQFCKTYHILHTYILTHVYTMYRMSDHIVSFWTKFRQDKNGGPKSWGESKSFNFHKSFKFCPGPLSK